MLEAKRTEKSVLEKLPKKMKEEEARIAALRDSKKNLDKHRTYEARDEVQILNELAHKAVIADIQREIGERLEEVREMHGIKSQKQVAEQYNIYTHEMLGNDLVSSWERGDHRVDLIYFIWFAEAFNVDLHWLITGERKNQIVQELTEKLESALELSRKL